MLEPGRAQAWPATVARPPPPWPLTRSRPPPCMRSSAQPAGVELDPSLLDRRCSQTPKARVATGWTPPSASPRHAPGGWQVAHRGLPQLDLDCCRQAQLYAGYLHSGSHEARRPPSSPSKRRNLRLSSRVSTIRRAWSYRGRCQHWQISPKARCRRPQAQWRLLRTPVPVVAPTRGQHWEAAELTRVGATCGPGYPGQASGADVARMLFTLRWTSRRSAVQPGVRHDANCSRTSTLPATYWDLNVLVLAWFAQLGALDDAYATGQRTCDGDSSQSPALRLRMDVDARDECIPAHPRFQAVMGRLGMTPYWEKYRPPVDCDLENGKLSCR